MVHELSICPRQVLVQSLAFSRSDLQASDLPRVAIVVFSHRPPCCRTRPRRLRRAAAEGGQQQLYAVGVAFACGEVERRPTIMVLASLSVPALGDLKEQLCTSLLAAAHRKGATGDRIHAVEPEHLQQHSGMLRSSS